MRRRRLRDKEEEGEGVDSFEGKQDLLRLVFVHRIAGVNPGAHVSACGVLWDGSMHVVVEWARQVVAGR